MGVIFANKQTIQKMRDLEDLKEHVLFEVPLNKEVDARVADHTDLSVFISDFVCVAPCIYEAFLSQMLSVQDARFKRLGEKVVRGTLSLKKDYPFDSAYNAVKLKNHFFHKLRNTEPKILDALTCEKVNVGQGYTRCSTMVLTENAVITEDIGLALHYKTLGYEVLIIEKGHVILPGFNYGFFGGSGGVVENKLVINGALRHHPDGDAILQFVHSHGLKIIELHDDPLIDCGSILYFMT